MKTENSASEACSTSEMRFPWIEVLEHGTAGADIHVLANSPGISGHPDRCSRNNIYILNIDSSDVRGTSTVFSRLRETTSPGDRIYLTLEPLHYQGRRFFPAAVYHRIMSLLKDGHYRVVHTYGVEPSLTAPRVVASLRRDVLYYLTAEAYRHLDNPFKRTLKKALVKLFGKYTWKGCTIILCEHVKTETLQEAQ